MPKSENLDKLLDKYAHCNQALGALFATELEDNHPGTVIFRAKTEEIRKAIEEETNAGN